MKPTPTPPNAARPAIPCAIRRLLDVALVLTPALIIASLLGVPFLQSANLPTGGDTASHLLYAWIYAREILPTGRITAWMPEVFAGFPLLSYYFPLPYLVMAGLSTVMAFGPAMKWGMTAAAMALPGAVWLGSVYLLRLPRPVAVWGVLATLALLLHEQHSIWGGNLLSTLSGEFAYSYGMLFAVLALFAWQRAIATGQHWRLAAVLEAAAGFSHGFALLATGFATLAFLADRRRWRLHLRLLVQGHALAFFLLAGWLWPLLEMHDATIPNETVYQVEDLRDLWPATLQPVLAAGLLALALWLLIESRPSWRNRLPMSIAVAHSLRHAVFMATAALTASVGFLAAGRLGLADIRFFPFVWLFGGLACAWLWGGLLLRLANACPPWPRWGLRFMSMAAATAFAGWISLQVAAVTDWGLWNHAGLESKPQWNLLTRLFPHLSGRLDSPRLLFEHDPANHDIGSTRALEALPMFLGGRPVLEGLFMESALLGPAIYQLQSEISAQPSSPLSRFPSGSLDVPMAAEHLPFLWANEVLIRSEAARQALAASPLFAEVAAAPPFYVFRLKHFATHLVDLPDRPLRWLPRTGWMEESYRWFRSRQRFPAELPVFHDGRPPPSEIRRQTAVCAGERQGATPIHDVQLERQRLRWCTEAVGQAHLVRMAWHPRWRLISKGQLYLAAPGFMLVMPAESAVVLEYRHTRLGRAGLAATVLSLLWIVLSGRREFRNRRAARRPAGMDAPPAPWPQDRGALVWLALLALIGAGVYLQDPQRLYRAAWNAMQDHRFVRAAELFDRVYELRQSDARREEALFWAARAHETAGRQAEALARYRELTAGYYGYWRPESLYRQARLAHALGDWAEAQTTADRLRREFPNNDWTRLLAAGDAR